MTTAMKLGVVIYSSNVIHVQLALFSYLVQISHLFYQINVSHNKY